MKRKISGLYIQIRSQNPPIDIAITPYTEQHVPTIPDTLILQMLYEISSIV